MLRKPICSNSRSGSAVERNGITLTTNIPNKAEDEETMIEENYVQCIQYNDIMVDVRMAIDGKHNKYVGLQTNA
jgi:hypothetical protein